MRWVMGTRRRAIGSSLALHSATPASEALERRQLLASTILFNPTGPPATFPLATGPASNSFFEIYSNPAVVADNLAGTGFNQGTLILSGKPAPSLTNSGNFALALDATGMPIPQPFDLFNPANYP